MIPRSWSELMDRLTRCLGGTPEARAEAEDWLRAAVEARWAVTTLHDLDRARRQVAFQKAAGVVLAVEEAGIPDELLAPDGDLPPMVIYPCGSIEPLDGYPGRRAIVAAAFARYFDGVALDGPPWRVSDLERDRPTYDEWMTPADFAGAADASVTR